MRSPSSSLLRLPRPSRRSSWGRTTSPIGQGGLVLPGLDAHPPHRRDKCPFLISYALPLLTPPSSRSVQNPSGACDFRAPFLCLLPPRKTQRVDLCELWPFSLHPPLSTALDLPCLDLICRFLLFWCRCRGGHGDGDLGLGTPIVGSELLGLCQQDLRTSGVFGYYVLNFSSATSDVRMLISRTKHELIIKLIAEL
ncbi:hypothetical protein SEVIR_4G114102v4 [Setaria viridis]